MKSKLTTNEIYEIRKQNNVMTLGSALQILRHETGMSQQQLSTRAGVSYPYISKVERGVIASPSFEVVCGLLDALGSTPDKLRAVMRGKRGQEEL